AEAERSLLKPPAAWQAHDYYLRAAAIFNTWTSDAKLLYEVRDLLQQCISIDADYARAHALLSHTYILLAFTPIDENFLKGTVCEAAGRHARKALQLDSTLPQAHAVHGIVLSFQRQHDEAIAAFEKAIALNPNFTEWRFGTALIFAGEFERAIDVIDAHMRL